MGGQMLSIKLSGAQRGLCLLHSQGLMFINHFAIKNLGERKCYLQVKNSPQTEPRGQRLNCRLNLLNWMMESNLPELYTQSSQVDMVRQRTAQA